MRLAVFVVGLVLWSNSAAGQRVVDPIGSGDSLVWRMPPTSPNMQMLMAPFMGILPDVAPFLPGPGVDVNTLPAATVGGVIQLTDGDTLRLEAALLRREFEGQTVKVYGFNGQSPGPTIRVPQHATNHRRVHEPDRLPHDPSMARRAGGQSVRWCSRSDTVTGSCR